VTQNSLQSIIFGTTGHPPTCPVHHPKKHRPTVDPSIKAAQEKQRPEKAIANAIGLRVFSAIVAAVPFA